MNPAGTDFVEYAHNLIQWKADSQRALQTYRFRRALRFRLFPFRITLWSMLFTVTAFVGTQQYA